MLPLPAAAPVLMPMFARLDISLGRPLSGS